MNDPLAMVRLLIGWYAALTPVTVVFLSAAGATTWALPPNCGDGPTTGSLSAAIASASAMVRVWAGLGWPGPRLFGEPGMIVRTLVPIDWIWPVIAALAPLPSAISATTDATPMMTPSIVSSERILLASKLSRASRATSIRLTLPCVVSSSGASTSASLPRAGTSAIIVAIDLYLSKIDN